MRFAPPGTSWAFAAGRRPVSTQAPIPAAIMPPLGGQSVVARAPGAPAVKVAFADPVAYEAPPIPPNPYTADSGVQSFKRSWANPSAWAPEALAPNTSGAKAPQNP